MGTILPGVSCADLRTRINNILIGSANVTSPGLVIGSTPDQVATIAFAYTINGVSYYKAAVAAGTAFATADVIADGDMSCYKVSIQTDGTITLTSPSDLTKETYSEALGVIAATPSGELYIGYVLIDNQTGGNFTINTTSLAASGATVYYVNQDDNVIGTL